MNASKKHFWSMSIVMLLATVLLASCSSADDALGEVTPAKPNTKLIHFTSQLGSKGGNSQSARATGGSLSDASRGELTEVTDPDDGTLNAEWKANETVALIYEVGGTKYIREAGVTSVTAGVATIEGDLEGSPADNTPVKIVYPYAAADKETESGIKADYLKAGQDGTLETISAKYDVAVGNGNLVVSGTAASLKEMTSVENQYAICKFTFKQSGTAITGINYLSVGDLVIRGSNLDAVYVAFDPSVSGVKRFTVLNRTTNSYTGTASPSLTAGTFYRPTISLTQLGHKVVDLGLPSGTLWATYNVGATSPEEYGQHYAWGETTGYNETTNWTNSVNTTAFTKTAFSESTYRWYWDGAYHFDCYDSNKRLLPEYDAATVNWGGAWCMPTVTQAKELSENCYWVWTTGYNGTTVAGYIVYEAKEDAHKGKKKFASSGDDYTALYNTNNDTHIFLPVAGYFEGSSQNYPGSIGMYWVREFDTITNTSARAFTLRLDESSVDPERSNRSFHGRSVRAVLAQ